MKIIRVTESAHQSVKLAAVKAGVSVSEMSSHLLKESVSLLNKGVMLSPKLKGGKS